MSETGSAEQAHPTLYLVYIGEDYARPRLSAFFPALGEATLHAQWLMETHPETRLLGLEWERQGARTWRGNDNFISIEEKQQFPTHAEWLAWVKSRTKK